MAHCSQCHAELDSDFGIQICPQCGHQNVFDIVGNRSEQLDPVSEEQIRSSQEISPLVTSYELNESVQYYNQVNEEVVPYPTEIESPAESHSEPAPVVYYEIGEEENLPEVDSATVESSNFLGDLQDYADRSDGPTFRLEYDVVVSQLDFKSQVNQIKEICDELALDEQKVHWNPQSGELKVQHLSMPRLSLLIKKLGVLNVDYNIVASN